MYHERRAESAEPQLGVRHRRRSNREHGSGGRPRFGFTIPIALSFVWPGLGHAYLGRRRRAVAFGLPPALLLVGLVGAAVVDPTGFAIALLATSFALAVTALIAVHGTWRVAAIIDTWRAARPDNGRGRAAGVLPLLLLSAAIVGVHGAAIITVQSYANAGEQIFQGDRPTGESDIDFLLGGVPAATPGPLATTAAVAPDPTAGEPNPTPGVAVAGDTNGDGVFDWNDEGWVEDETDLTGEEPSDEPDDDEHAGEPAPSFDPALTPPPLPAGDAIGKLPDDGPITVLFVGLDSGQGRKHSLTDSLIVASYYPARDKLTMISVPRDTSRLPMYKGGTYPRRINTFLGYARANPKMFPEGPVAALMKQIGYVLGTPIHFYAATDLDGMPKVIDLVGGVDVVLDRAIADPRWNFYLEPGKHHLDGQSVMPYVRSRYGPGNSDWQRARRQQQVIRAAAAKVRDPRIAVRLPQIIDGMTDVVRTNVPRNQVSVLVRILEKANDASTEHIVLSPNRYARRIPAAETGGAYMTELNMAAVRELSIRVFGSYSRYR
jgi:LCP family protein required for cell wall assembly